MPNYADALRRAPQQPAPPPQPTVKANAQKQTPKKRRIDNKDESKSSQQQQQQQQQQPTWEDVSSRTQKQKQKQQGAHYAAKANDKTTGTNNAKKNNSQQHHVQNRKKKGHPSAAPKKTPHQQQPGKTKGWPIPQKNQNHEERSKNKAAAPKGWPIPQKNQNHEERSKNKAAAPKAIIQKPKPPQFLDTSQDAFPALGGKTTTQLSTQPVAKPLNSWKPMPPLSNAETLRTETKNPNQTNQNTTSLPASEKPSPTKVWGKVPVVASNNSAAAKQSKNNNIIISSSTEQPKTAKEGKKKSMESTQAKKSSSKKSSKTNKKNSTSTHALLLEKRPDAAFDPTRLGMDMALFGGQTTAGNRKEETKKGRQRIRPRKKKFTTLKKKVLQERLDKWRDANPSSSTSQEETKSQTKQQTSSVSPSCVVGLYNYVEPEELEDEEEYEEIVANLTEMAKKVGSLKSVYIPKPNDNDNGTDQNVGVACILFDRSDDAKAAVACWDGMFLGGQDLRARSLFHDVVFRPEDPTQFWDSVLKEKQQPVTQMETGKNEHETTIALQDILTEDDFEDDDCLEESLEDIRSMAEEIGPIQNLRADKIGPEGSGIVLITYHGVDSVEMAKRAIEKFSGIVIGGATVSASIVNDKDEENSHKAETTSWLVLENILTADDLEDEDCLEETKADISDLAQHYGRVVSVDVDLNSPSNLIKLQLEGATAASSAVEKFDGLVVGGLTVTAKVLQQDNQEPAASESNPSAKHSEDEKKESNPARMFSGDKLIPERYAECKRVPKIPNATSGPRPYAVVTGDEKTKTLLVEMLGELMRLQRRAMEDKNAKARRRIVMGLREVARGIRAHKVKMVVVANNLDEYGVIDEKVQTILDLAREESVPMFFEFSKRTLGKALGKSIKVAVVGIQNADGAHQQFKKLLALDPSL